jgi:hypothetical protein
MRRAAGIIANIAIPLWLCTVMFPGAFGLLALPASLVATFGGFSVLWAQVFFWSCLLIVVGLFIQIFKPVSWLISGIPAYVWFEYPGLITASIMSFAYSAALISVLGIGSTFVAVGFTLAIGTRFFFRWLEIHLTWFNIQDTSGTD